ncbi:hypothetical protein SISNIDRAFT_420711 [Sistotremastrum niveocremeum HHB9708]|uniref:Uncharacterized protein n=2 Tax=Sistotremastraceae TaxID=3402574 RepID=A0A164MDB1_9AGAM|nr:hypothetical protein SISNIDRAFT_420711 [Sistotremastrum niveocremeum HHB9708]KZT39422.1 hypothetical protein SISSUDRAFT_984797 [Sistotremastrum suecicum HHB10207 ss-3]
MASATSDLGSTGGLSAAAQKKKIIDAFQDYVARWQGLNAHTTIRFATIPWPVLNDKLVTSPEQLTSTLIAAFLLSPHHSGDKSRKDRIKAELLRWHPDRFEGRYLAKVVESDKENVKAAVGEVARCLSDLLSMEGSFGA